MKSDRNLSAASNDKISSVLSFAIISALMVSAFAVLAFMFPYAGDDWAWGSAEGIKRLDIFFDNYNGRYLGNFLVLAITRSKLLKVVLMALFYYVSCWLCYKYTNHKRNASLLLAMILFIFMSRSMFAQAVAWASGFANYVPSAVITVLYIIMVSNITAQDTPVYKKYLWPITFLMGLCGALFIENITVFNVFFGFAVIVFVAVRFKKFYSVHIAFLIGAVIGAVIMFSNSAYLSVLKGTDGYRKSTTGRYNLQGNGYFICEYLFGYNYALCVVISVLLLVITVLFVKKSSCVKRKKCAIAAISVNGVCTLAICLRYVLMPRLLMNAVITVGIAYFISALAVILLCIEKQRVLKMILPFVCAPISVLPLMVVSPIGPRCFYVSYLLSMLFAVDLFGYVVYESNIISNTNFKKLFGALSIASVAAVVIYTGIFATIYNHDKKRNEFALLQAERGEKQIVVSTLPNRSFVWTATPIEEIQNPRYKAFYGIDDKNAEIVTVTPEEFEEYYDKYMAEKV